MKRLVLFFALLLSTPAVAQWQTPNHSFPVGRGGGTIGFGSVGPCASGVAAVGQGLGADPQCGPLANVGLAVGAANTFKGTLDGVANSDISFTTAARTPIGTSGATIPLLNGNNTFSGTNIFSTGLTVGSGASAPATPDLYSYSASTSAKHYFTRDQVLGAGTPIGDLVYIGKNASGTSFTWADVYGAPPDCRGRPSFAGFPCAPNVLVAGSEEGAFFITNTAIGNTVTLATNAITAAGSAILHFASSVQDSGNLIGKVVTNATHPTSIPAGTFVRQQSSTTITLSNNVAAPGVSSADSISFTGPDLSIFDANGLSIRGQRNVDIPAGFGLRSFDSAGTAVYNVSYNSHGSNTLDLQTCNDLSFPCLGLGANAAFRLFISSSASFPAVIQVNYDTGIILRGLNTHGVGVSKICIDASGYLTTNTCP